MRRFYYAVAYDVSVKEKKMASNFSEYFTVLAVVSRPVRTHTRSNRNPSFQYDYDDDCFLLALLY